MLSTWYAPRPLLGPAISKGLGRKSTQRQIFAPTLRFRSTRTLGSLTSLSAKATISHNGHALLPALFKRLCSHSARRSLFRTLLAHRVGVPWEPSFSRHSPPTPPPSRSHPATSMIGLQVHSGIDAKSRVQLASPPSCHLIPCSLSGFLSFLCHTASAAFTSSCPHLVLLISLLDHIVRVAPPSSFEV